MWSVWDPDHCGEDGAMQIPYGWTRDGVGDAETAAAFFCERRFAKDDYPMMRKVHVRAPNGHLTVWNVETRNEPAFYARKAE
jgi:hypothetical protein